MPGEELTYAEATVAKMLDPKKAGQSLASPSDARRLCPRRAPLSVACSRGPRLDQGALRQRPSEAPPRQRCLSGNICPVPIVVRGWKLGAELLLGGAQKQEISVVNSLPLPKANGSSQVLSCDHPGSANLITSI